MFDVSKKTPAIGVGVYIYNEKKEILLGKRKNAHGNGTWCPPGGHLEWNETPEECACRETTEETGLTISHIEPMGFTNDIFFEEGRHYITLHMKAIIVSGKTCVMEPDKCERWDWFEWDNFPSPLFLPVQNLRKTLL